MQIKTTMRYHFTPIRMVIIKKKKENNKWWGYGEIRKLEPSGIAGGAGTVGNSLVVHQYVTQNYHMAQQFRS